MRKTRLTLVIPCESEKSPYIIPLKKPLLGVGFLAAVAMRAGFETEIIDAFIEELSPQQVLNRIVEFRSSVVGISLHLLAYRFVTDLVGLCRERGILVVVGGPEVTLNSERVMEEIRPDVAVIGEGENTLLDLLEVHEKMNCWSIDELQDVQGIAYFVDTNKIVTTKLRSRITTLDDLPFFPYEEYPLDLYNLQCDIVAKNPVIPLYTSRGCPFECSFCSSREVWNRRCYFMSGQRVVDEIENIKTKFSPAGLQFQDDHFTLNRNRVIEICEGLIHRKIDLPWICLSRAERLDVELLRLMQKAGCKGMWFGIESGSKRVLSIMRKNIDLDSAISIIQNGKKLGMAIGVSMIVGYPTQTLQEEMETVDFLEKAKATFVMISPYIGYPGSETYRQYLMKGSKYIYSEQAGIILPNSEDLDWPQKVIWAQKLTRRFNWTPRLLWHEIKTLGLFRTTIKIVKRIV